MENQNQGPGNPHPTAPTQQNAALIRTDQVQKLPHLTDAQKATHTQAVRTLWEIMNTQPPNTPEHTNAQIRLSQLSQKLMAEMRKFHANRTQQQQAQAQAHQQMHLQQQQQAAQQANRQAGGAGGAGAVAGQPQRQASATQLLPQYQARVNAINFTLPPTIPKDATEGWIAEARVRYGLALQKHDMGKAKLQEIKQQYGARQVQGNLTQEELREMETRRLAAEKMFREGLEFLNKFKDQQAQFKVQQQQQQHQQQQQQQQGQMNQQQQGGVGVSAAAAQNVPTSGPAVKTEPSLMDGSRAPGQQPSGTSAAPAPHTINSAVVAARNQTGQTGQQTAASQAMQPNSQLAGQSPAQGQMPAQSFPQQPTGQAPQQSQPQQAQQPNGASSTAPQGPPRPLSQQAAISQAYSNAMSQQTATQAGSTHAHPQGYMNSRTDNNSRNVTMNIPKNLNVQAPEPVTMGPSRPTLSAGPTHGAVGVMGQPAIQKHPGYVLEGEGQRVLSKKKLDILVKQVTGGGEGEGLTPDAEEFILQMADDFVDDVITAACRLAKLRPSATLDIRDLQLVLERNYNMRIPGFSSDDLRTVRKPHPTQGWTQKMSAIQAAKMTQGRTE